MSQTEKEQPKDTDKKLDLGLLEEDDEFEEFPADGKSNEPFVNEQVTDQGLQIGKKNRKMKT